MWKSKQNTLQKLKANIYNKRRKWSKNTCCKYLQWNNDKDKTAAPFIRQYYWVLMRTVSSSLRAGLSSRHAHYTGDINSHSRLCLWRCGLKGFAKESLWISAAGDLQSKAVHTQVGQFNPEFLQPPTGAAFQCEETWAAASAHTGGNGWAKAQCWRTLKSKS